MLHTPTDQDIEQSRLTAFAEFVKEQTGQDFGKPGAEAYKKLHRWSVEESEAFHSLAWEFLGVIGDKGDRVIESPDDFLASQFFPDAKISFSENMLKRVKTHPYAPAMIARVAGVSPDRVLSWQDVYDAVSQWEQVLEAQGVGEGDRIATYTTHCPEAYILMMAAANRGAIFSSVGSDMGVPSAIERFQQIEPKLLIASDGYPEMRPGKEPVMHDKVQAISEIQAQVSSIKSIIILNNIHDDIDVSGFNVPTVVDALKDVHPREMQFERRDFNTPLAILFSSGSTGKPKCFVHGVGGTLLKHGIEYQLQSDLRGDDRTFFHSTTSWMMFNWNASGLANDATIMIYEGSPAYPDAGAQLQFAADYGCTHLGTAADIIHLWKDKGVTGEGLDLSNLRAIQYTASVLSEDGFAYVYEAIKADVAVNGICGGTDFVGCYAAGNPWVGTQAGYLKGPVLGMDLHIWDDDGHALTPGNVGELVIRSAFVSKPLAFWGDEDGSRYYEAYFAHFEDVSQRPVWRHGDAVKIDLDGQVFVEGRSDATLNQGGVRIGSQQIYNGFKDPRIMDLVVDGIAVNFKNAQGGDNTILFIVPKDFQEGDAQNPELKALVKQVMKDEVSGLSAPREIIQVPYVLRPSATKRAEKPTAQLLAGQEIKAPETYGMTEDGRLKADLYRALGEELRAHPKFGFVQNEAAGG